MTDPAIARPPFGAEVDGRRLLAEAVGFGRALRAAVAVEPLGGDEGDVCAGAAGGEVGAAEAGPRGVVVGAAIGAITGNAGQGAGIGAVTGGAESARISDREKANVVSNCLRGRGYRVLN